MSKVQGMKGEGEVGGVKHEVVGVEGDHHLDSHVFSWVPRIRPRMYLFRTGEAGFLRSS